ncbi:class II aldolase/adducin family protein [Sutterella sp.]|uniref:class II aldolase/adducin family protein n=1 Tax=Sutterella sp. TaxID=1981025 RepID=UPI0026E06E78|nr:class II aldolase/adducin family protein [Sutterella sp.]MDO5530694.1 class II aldolase/adducin family protein [Sutterella sp.]
MRSEETELRSAVIATALEMNRRGINVNKSGNVSARLRDGFIITPTGIPYEHLVPADLIFVRLADNAMEGERLPSSEWEMHAEVYRLRADAQAIVHCHSCFATALACQNLPIPAFHYMVAAAGGDSIDVVPYRTFGTHELALAAAEGLREKNACLLEHHGSLALGKNLEKALAMAAEVENLAHQYCVVRQLGDVRLIPADEMRRVIEKFRTYGLQPGEKR